MSNLIPWRVQKRKVVYQSPWVNLYQDTVQLPDGTIIEDHHVVDYPRNAAGVIPLGNDGRVLLIEHYRFITQTRGWEIPAGRIDDREEPQQAAARELIEEAAHVAGSITALGRYYAAIGSSNLAFHLFVARNLTPTGGKVDTNEVLDVRWFPVSELRQLIVHNAILDGLSLTALLWAMQMGIIQGT
jgi:8-oxo-dGTP pyrophosphatase MutT (NUDIX family)